MAGSHGHKLPSISKAALIIQDSAGTEMLQAENEPGKRDAKDTAPSATVHPLNQIHSLLIQFPQDSWRGAPFKPSFLRILTGHNFWMFHCVNLIGMSVVQGVGGAHFGEHLSAHRGSVSSTCPSSFSVPLLCFLGTMNWAVSSTVPFCHDAPALAQLTME